MSPILIMGDSGNGKTTSLRNLDPKTTVIIDADKKGLSWKGWRSQYNEDNKNYIRTDYAQVAEQWLEAIDTKDSAKHIKTVVIDTINGIMIADEMRRMKDKGFDKWQDMAQSIYNLVQRAMTVRDDLLVIFIAHTQTERDEMGNTYTKVKTSGRKLDKICVESWFSTVLWAKCIDGEYVFETQSNNSTAKSPMGMFDELRIPNDMAEVVKKVEEF